MSPSCPITPTADPVNLVIFGGTGDLAMRKIYPALSVLFQSGLLSPDSRIVASGRTDMSPEKYQRLVREKLSGALKPPALDEFVSRA